MAVYFLLLLFKQADKEKLAETRHYNAIFILDLDPLFQRCLIKFYAMAKHQNHVPCSMWSY